MATVTNTQRWASPSPLDRARHASAERKRSSEEEVTKGYKTLFETVNPLIEGLNTRVGTLEARLTAQEAHSQQEVEGLKARITQLEAELQGRITNVERLAQSALDRANNHTHKVRLEMLDGTYYPGYNGVYDSALGSAYFKRYPVYIPRTGGAPGGFRINQDMESEKPT
jgi:hypothetical protein